MTAAGSATTGFDATTLERLADLAVGFGANVQPGQIVAINAEIGKEEMVRALAASAYRHGARFVDPVYFDMHVKRARILHAEEDTLDFVPSWYGERMLELGRQRCARIGIAGPATPGLLNDLDPARAGRDQLPATKETGVIVNEATTNWTIIPFPNAAWARQVHPDLDPDEALRRLGEQVAHVCRLDEADPVAAWRERADVLVGAAARLTDRAFTAIRFEGEGTDLTVGLLPTSKFIAAQFETVGGIRHMPNIPSEEVFSAPGPAAHRRRRARDEAARRRGLDRPRPGGRVPRRAGRCASTPRRAATCCAATPPGTTARARLGEVALVDREGRIGRLGTTFFDTLLDENAASHIALGQAYSFTAGAEDRDRLNRSGIHVDFMIGGDDVDVSGVTADGDEVPVLRGGVWQI